MRVPTISSLDYLCLFMNSFSLLFQLICLTVDYLVIVSFHWFHFIFILIIFILFSIYIYCNHCCIIYSYSIKLSLNFLCPFRSCIITSSSAYQSCPSNFGLCCSICYLLLNLEIHISLLFRDLLLTSLPG